MPCVCAEPVVVNYAGLCGAIVTGFPKRKCDHGLATVSALQSYGCSGAAFGKRGSGVLGVSFFLWFSLTQ